MEYKKINLYGGAGSTLIPKGFLDASTIRQIPDNQEVFVNDTNSHFELHDSLIIELLEQLDEPDSANIQTHLDEIFNMSDNHEPYKIQNVDQLSVSSRKFDPSLTSAYVCVANSTFIERNKGKTPIYLVMGLIRNKAKQTDILVTMNLRDRPDEKVETAKQVVKKIISEFEVDDSLFG